MKARLLAGLLFFGSVLILLPQFVFALTVPAGVGPVYAQYSKLSATQSLVTYKELGGVVKFQVVNVNESGPNRIDTGKSITIRDSSGKIVGGSEDDDGGIVSMNEVDLRGDGHTVDVKQFGADQGWKDIPLDTKNVNQGFTANTNESAARARDQNNSSNSSGGGGSGGSPSDRQSSGTVLVPCDGASDCTIRKLLDMGANIYNYIVGMGALVAVGAIVMAGFSYIKSAGDAKQMADAKNKIVLAIIGLVIMGASVLLVNTLLKVFGSNLTVETVDSSMK